MSGYAPLSHREIEAWSRNTGHAPTALECEALVALDAVIRNPEHGKDATDG